MEKEGEMRPHEDHIHDTIVQQLLIVYCRPGIPLRTQSKLEDATRVDNTVVYS